MARSTNTRSTTMAKAKAPKNKPDGDNTPAPKRDKAAAFVKLANKRLPKLLRQIESVASLANKGSYTVTVEQNDKLQAVVKAATDAMLARFEALKSGAAVTGGSDYFSL